MKKIDKQTVTRILDTADIVEVVSDFVSLKKRGANYIGLCPFHNERTPSFSVSKAKGICYCFSCHQGGSPVNFLMQLEKMSYQEALRWLAKKYNIEIQESEETEEERREASLRESLFAINNFALNSFEYNLFDTEEGRNIGLTYFLERGLTIETIKKFHLGYVLQDDRALFNLAVKEGYSNEILSESGLFYSSKKGFFDRFKGRVIYPVHTISGKVIAFGGRTLSSDKDVAKYVNSPETAIYVKSRELYGIYQASKSIQNKQKCYLVEGYMDVLSMSQSGIENVVASSGTALTYPQIRLIRRLTENVTVIYDADPAGIKASLRGVDMLLSEGMKVKVVLFPDGEDPDSFAQSHSKTELEQYLKDNETDFIRFKTKILMKDAENDPIKRSEAISDILLSIAKIPDSLTRQIYSDECARTFGLDPKMLSLEVAKRTAQVAEEAVKKERQEAAQALRNAESHPQDEISEGIDDTPVSNALYQYEHSLMTYLVKYGMLIIGDFVDEAGNMTPRTVLEYVDYELETDSLTFSDPVMLKLYKILQKKSEEWPDKIECLAVENASLRETLLCEGRERIKSSASSLTEIEKAEKDLMTNIDSTITKIENEARRIFFEHDLLSDMDNDIRTLVTDMVTEKYRLSKYHSKFANIVTDEEQLSVLVPRAVYELKDAILKQQITDLNAQITQCDNDDSRTSHLLMQLMDKMKIRSEFARYLGDRIITPKIGS
ncbi:MAG: DNA primase [Muribaculaceae bacterium]|nr:DNA primase [Muribaculaceae bacterium]